MKTQYYWINVETKWTSFGSNKAMYIDFDALTKIDVDFIEFDCFWTP